MMIFATAVLLGLHAGAASAAVVKLDWTVGWTRAAPDGFPRPVIGINGQWPPPPIHVNVNDTLIINLTNGLVNETTALHFHGENQKNSSQMEGAAGVTQCPIPPGNTFTYNFTVSNTGTQWYHAHIGGQYMDGFRGPMIVHDVTAPFMAGVDAEYVMTVSDWYHQQAPPLINFYQSKQNGAAGGPEPLPNSVLINDRLNAKFNLTPGKKYLFRIINMSAYASQFITFDQHTMSVVEMDAVATHPTDAKQIKIHAAQRYGVIIQAKNVASKNFAVVVSMDLGMFGGDTLPKDFHQNVTGYLVYNNTKPLPSPPKIAAWTPLDDMTVFPFDNAKLLGPVTQSVILNFDFKLINGMTRGVMNGTTYIAPVVPTIFTALSAPRNLAADARIYGKNTNTVVFNNTKGIAEIVIFNHDVGSHPFHIHGHIAQVIEVSPPFTTRPAIPGPYPVSPTKRDVFMVNGGGYTTIRFKTGNPGIWLLHCHIEWHVEAGLVMTFVEDPLQLQDQNLVIPKNHLDACKAMHMPTQGNAAGNSIDWLDLTGANTIPDQNPHGALIKPS